MGPAVEDPDAFADLEMIHTHGAAANKLQRAHIHTHEDDAKERPPELHSTNLDTDWTYRKLLPGAWGVATRAGGVAWS